MPRKFCALEILWASLGNPAFDDLGSASPGELISQDGRIMTPEDVLTHTESPRAQDMTGPSLVIGQGAPPVRGVRACL